MLYHLAGVQGLSRPRLRQMAATAWYRQNPRELERVAVDVMAIDAERRRLAWAADGRRRPPEHSPTAVPQAPAPSMRSWPGRAQRLRQWIERFVP